jgi:iron(III) transport system permease protein
VGQNHRPALTVSTVILRPPNLRQIVMPLVVLLCGALVLYPIGFLIAESLNTGDPSVFPPEEFGLDNYTNLIDDVHVLANTALVSCIATVLAVLFGFLQAWILTRTNIPGRQRLERLMELPYYMTPWHGACCWGRRPVWSIRHGVPWARRLICSTSTRPMASPG